VARNVVRPAAMSAVVSPWTAGTTWQATNRFQMSSYSRNMSRSPSSSRYGSARSGVHSSDVGRTASCDTASCASCAALCLVS
jgi:hypothetical protein